MSDKSTPEQKALEGNVTEQDLLKSIESLQTKKVDEPEDKKAEPTIDVKVLEKSVADTVNEKATDSLKKAVEVSDKLAEFASLIGIHVDASLGALEKSVQEGAKRDLAIVQVLVDLTKSVKDLGAKLEQLGQAPGNPKTVTATPSQILEKTAGGDKAPLKPEVVRSKISGGLVELVKSAATPEDRQRWATVAARFESAGAISDVDMTKAIAALDKAKN